MKRLRHIVTLLCSAVIVSACSSETTAPTPPAISLNLDPTSASAAQGEEVTVALTLTRLGGFEGDVDFSVTGAPTTVSPQVTDIETPTDQATTATLTVDVDPAAAPGTYALVVHGTANGVTETTATFTLTVIAAP